MAAMKEEEEQDIIMMKQPLLAAAAADSSNPPPQSHPPYNPKLITYLYTGHFLARWGARMWEFSVGLYMINIWPESLLLAAAYGVVESASTALFGSVVGQWVDRLTYIQVLRLWMLTQNLSFIVAGITVTALLIFSGLRLSAFGTFISLIVLTNISGAVGVLSTLGGTILIEREWVIVISNGQPPGVLTEMNSVIRRIDLICKLFAPVLTGFIISFVSLKASALALALWNIVSVGFQYWLLTSVYNGIHALSENDQKRKDRLIKKKDPEEGSSVSLKTENSGYNQIHHRGNDSILVNQSWGQKLIGRLLRIPYINAWVLYSQQDVVLPGIALALLYFSVLSFGTLMTATLEWMGIPAYTIGIMRGISAIVGIAATLLYPHLHSRISTLRTGLWSIWIQWSFLLVCVASVWVRNSHLAAWMLMGGVAASRLGLWMFDLSVMQQMQDYVPDSDRCIVGGVQNSLQSILDLLTNMSGIIISNPQDFGTLTIMSFLPVTIAALLYSFHIYRVRKHLFHFEKLYITINWFLRR